MAGHLTAGSIASHSPNGRLADRTQALLRVASAAAGTERLADVLPALARAAAEAIGADQASVYAYDATRTRTVAAGHYAAGDPLDLASLANLEALDDQPPSAVPAEAEIIRSRRPLLRDASTPFPDPVATVPWRSDVVVPLLAQGEVLGALYVREIGRERVFDADDLALLEAIGHQAGLAVRRARDAAARRADHPDVLNQTGRALTAGLAEAYAADDVRVPAAVAQQAAAAFAHARLFAATVHAREAAEHHAADLEAVMAITRVIASAPDLAAILATLADELGALLPHDELVLFRLRSNEAGARLGPILARKDGSELTLSLGSWTIAPDQGLVGAAFSSGEALLVNDAHLDPRSQYLPDDRAPYRTAGEHALIAPLVVAGQPIGVLYVNRIGGTPFDAGEFARFRLLAEQGAVAIRNAMLREDAELARAAQARQTANLASVLAVSRSIASAVDLPTMLGALADEVETLIPHREIALYRLANDGRLRPALYRKSGVDVESSAWSLAVGEGLIGSAFARGQAELVNEAHRDPRSVYLIEKERYRREGEHAMQAPLIVAGQPIGVLHLSRIGSQPFSEEEFATFRALADEAAVAIHNAQLLEETRAAHAQTARHAANLEAVLAATRAVAQNLRLDPMLAAVMAGIRGTVDSGWGVVTLWDEAAGALRIADAWGPDAETYRGLVVPLDGSVNGQVFQTGQPINGDIATGLPHFSPLGDRRLGRYVLCVPLRAEGRTIGTLEALRDEPGPFAADDLILYELLAGQIAVGVERARIYEIAVAAREESERQARSLEAVLAGSIELAKQTELGATLQAAGAGLARLVRYNALAILRHDPATDTLQTIHEQSSSGPAPQLHRIAVGQGIAGQAFADRQPACVGHAERDPRLNRAVWGTGPELDALFAEGLHIVVVPLIVEGVALGILALDRFGPQPGPFTDEEFAAVQLFAGQAAAAIRNAELASLNRDLYLGGIRALASAVDQKDQYTHGHSERVSAYARRIADALDLPQHEAEVVELAALLHDIGKIGVPDKILQKAGKLSPSERAVMMEHAAIGARMLAQSGAAALQPLAPLVLHHHEHVDGRGYPDGLIGGAIPLGAAIIGVADAFDTMVTNRPYRIRRPIPEALAELHRVAGTQFVPEVVNALERVVTADPRLPAALQLAGLAQPADPTTTGSIDEPDAAGRARAGLMGDPRPLRLLVELAGMTRHMPDLATYLDRVAAALHELDYEDVMLFLVEPDTGCLRLAAHAGSLRAAPVGTRQPFGPGAAGVVALRGHLINVDCVPTVPGHGPPGPSTPGSELAVPLTVDATTIGVLSVASANESAFADSDETVLTLIAEQVAVAVHVAQLHAAARRAAATDGLTGVLNHRAFYEELERAIAAGEPLSVVLFDVEGLKAANDSAGHLAGDALLRRVANTIQGSVRTGDAVARYGGDEFAAILRGADLATALAVAARVREYLLSSAEAAGSPRTTVRYGAAVLPDDGTTPYELVGVADARLYEMRAQFSGHAAD